ncbi:MAG: hypothetical protein SGI99_04175 [Pseudomonadota bacterium]|nr:hypothetical protein [Pseudomonadota bacterium]
MFIFIMQPLVIDKNNLEDEARPREMSVSPEIRVIAQQTDPGEKERNAQKRFIDAKERTWQRFSPNGKPWPSGGNMEIPLLANGGTGSIQTYTGLTAPLYVKLCVVGPGWCTGLRHAFIRYSDGETMAGLVPGTYEVRYLDLTTEKAARSRPIEIVVGDTRRHELPVAPKRRSADFEPMEIDQF